MLPMMKAIRGRLYADHASLFEQLGVLSIPRAKAGGKSFLQTSRPVLNERQRCRAVLFWRCRHQEALPIGGNVVQVVSIGYHRNAQRPNLANFDCAVFDVHFRRHQAPIRSSVVRPPAGKVSTAGRDLPFASRTRGPRLFVSYGHTLLVARERSCLRKISSSAWSQSSSSE